jgi:hypothetical protein
MLWADARTLRGRRLRERRDQTSNTALFEVCTVVSATRTGGEPLFGLSPCQDSDLAPGAAWHLHCSHGSRHRDSNQAGRNHVL